MNNIVMVNSGVKGSLEKRLHDARNSYTVAHVYLQMAAEASPSLHKLSKSSSRVRETMIDSLSRGATPEDESILKRMIKELREETNRIRKKTGKHELETAEEHLDYTGNVLDGIESSQKVNILKLGRFFPPNSRNRINRRVIRGTLNISPDNLTTVIGNLYQNAEEATDGLIHIDYGPVNGCYVISIINGVSTNGVSKNGHNKGIGLKSVKETVKAAGGNLLTGRIGDCFLAEVTIPYTAEREIFLQGEKFNQDTLKKMNLRYELADKYLSLADQNQEIKHLRRELQKTYHDFKSVFENLIGLEEKTYFSNEFKGIAEAIYKADQNENPFKETMLQNAARHIKALELQTYD